MCQRKQLVLLLAVAAPALLSVRAVPAAEPAEGVLVADSFEEGANAPAGWRKGAAVPGVQYLYDKQAASDGRRSVSLRKTAKRYFPIAQWLRLLPHQRDRPALRVAAEVKAADMTKAVIDVQFLDARGKRIKHQWVAYIGQEKPSDPPASHDWKTYSGAAAIPADTRQIGIALQIYGPGQVWFDELQVRYADSVSAATDGSEAPSTRPQAASPADSQIPEPIEVRTRSGGVARYLLIPPSEGAAEPAGGYPLLLALPGGSGSADFHSFVRQVHRRALGGRFVVAQPLAPPQVVWPARRSQTRWPATEECLAAVVDDVARRHSVNRRHVYGLAWSSSGPALYATLLQEQSPLAGAFIAMSVFKPSQLPPLDGAAGRRVYLLHSPQDAVCPYRMAADAQRRLAAAGAVVKLTDYDGGHGWHGPVLENIRAGMQWLHSGGDRR